MSSHSQELLIEAQSAGKARVTVMMLTQAGKTAAVVDQLNGLGATVGYVHDKTGYVPVSYTHLDVYKRQACIAAYGTPVLFVRH